MYVNIVNVKQMIWDITIIIFISQRITYNEVKILKKYYNKIKKSFNKF